MDKQTLIEKSCRYLAESEFNIISKEKALSDDLVSVKIYEEPIIAVADAGNVKFSDLKASEIIGEHFMLPTDWLPGAKSVISFFFPFTETIRSSNRADMSYPSKGWMNGRIEGQTFLGVFSNDMVKFLEESGYKAVAPSIDKRFISKPGSGGDNISAMYTSNWSERHVAYACGMGTFSLSKGLITEKGMAGRLTSIVTELQLLPDEKEYQDYTENCIMCGKCIDNCPVNAISFEHGKNHDVCSKFLSTVLSENSPWYGCGKCQVGVPCEARNPRAVK